MRKILNLKKKIEKILKKKKNQFRKKKFWLRYRNSTLVSVPNTDTEFRSDTIVGSNQNSFATGRNRQMISKNKQLLIDSKLSNQITSSDHLGI